jgi:hypothetical protein
MTNSAPPTLLDPLREKLLGFLAGGVSQSAAALACGVSDGLVSQILEEPEFLAALAARSVAKLETALAHDDSIEAAEAHSLKILKEKLPFVRSAVEAARIFKTLNEAHKRAAPATNQRPESLGAQQVMLVLPKAAAVHIQMNAQNQVIEIAGRSMATLPSRSLPSLSADRQQAAQDVKEKAKAADTIAADKILDGLANRPATLIGGVLKVL